MNINETTTLNAQIAIQDQNGNNAPVINLFANIDSGNMNITMTTTTINKALAADPNNAAEIQSQYAAFNAAVQSKAKELGFNIFA